MAKKEKVKQEKKKSQVAFWSRKNLIFLSIVIFYAVIFVFTGLCLMPNIGIFADSNPILAFAEVLGMRATAIEGSMGIVGIILLAVYIIIFFAAVLYESRFARINGRKQTNARLIFAYIGTAILCALLSYGLTMLLVGILNEEALAEVNLLIGETFGLSLLLFAVLFIAIGAVVMLFINMRQVNKPFKFFNQSDYDRLEDEDEDTDVTSSFDEEGGSTTVGGKIISQISADAAGMSLNGVSGSGTGGEGTSGESIGDKEHVFPNITKLDAAYNGYAVTKFASDDITLEELCEQFRNYLAKNEKLYFDYPTIRMFISGFAASRLSILEGLSGTGKSSLPRYFAKFINAQCVFLPVQTTWRDKTSILGYFNDFTKTYSETDLLLNLYDANYNPDRLYFVVLDEMNIAKVEYYFADFLSILEYPKDQWKLRVMNLPYNFIPPINLVDGYIQIPSNTYFVGTVNKDDSVQTITDKVYDRAITINFDTRNAEFTPKGKSEPIKLSASKLDELYASALKVGENRFNKQDLDKLQTVTNFINDEFDVTFGNRILNQIETIVPTYVACGGTKEEALDILLSRKVLSKLEGRFGDYVADALHQLLDLIGKTYGKGVFKYSEKAINQMLRRVV
ncbi:MAG: hypothetical protein LUD22_03280 [Coprobacillus sp.]|nr:hypothetical protein [Coprobacillus sp.]